MSKMNKIISRKKTYDNKTVLVWSDGVITQALGIYYPGRGVQGKLHASYALMIAEEACLFNASEMPDLIRAGRKLGNNITPHLLRVLADANIRDNDRI